jgi:hypothetical protein
MAKAPQKVNLDDSDLRTGLIQGSIERDDAERIAVRADEVSEGRIFGLNAVERMILSIILFLTVTVLGVALLLITGTIKIS